MTVHGNKNQSGFTLIELLVVIAIITLLLGILSPGLSALNRHATGLKQKSQLSAIGIGLELFKRRYDNYPNSRAVVDGDSSKVVTGAHHLVEALLGRDEQGYDPKSLWHGPGETAITDLYRNDTDFPEGRTSLNRRYKLFVELKATGVYRLDQIYDPAIDPPVNFLHSGTGTGWNESPVFTDIFKAKKIVNNGENVKVGSPILYYRANYKSQTHYRDVVQKTNTSNWIYDFNDNKNITGDIINGPVGLKSLRDDTKKNVLTQAKFYEMITNPHSVTQTTSAPPNDIRSRPFNQNSFILISAGWDGVYGTKDDITNFGY